ncbi:MAG: response regulator [Ginsengibacter sp.]
MSGNIKKVLIIDDNEDIVAMLKTMLEMKGYNVYIKLNVTGLEESISDILPDLIIMDMLLSSVDGRTVCKSLKNDKRFASIPVLMISAHPSAKEKCLDAGADLYLAKPFDMKDFFSTVEKAMLMAKQ